MTTNSLWNFEGMWLSAEILQCKKLNNTDIVIFGYIKNLAFRPQGCAATNVTLGAMARVGKQTVSNTVAKLKDLGFITTNYIQRGDNSTQRIIKVDPHFYAKNTETAQKWVEEINAINIDDYEDPPINILIGVDKNFNSKVEKRNRKESKKEKAVPAVQGDINKNLIVTNKNVSTNNKCYKLYDKVISQPETRAECIAQYYFSAFHSNKGNHPKVSDNQMKKGLLTIAELMGDVDEYDNDRVIQIVKDYFCSKVLLNSDFRWNLFTDYNLLSKRCGERHE